MKRFAFVLSTLALLPIAVAHPVAPPAAAPSPAPARAVPCKTLGDLSETSVYCNIAPGQAKELLDSPAAPAVAPPVGTSWTERKHEFFCTHDRVTAEDGVACEPCPLEGDDRYSIQERTVTVGAAASPWRVLGYTCLNAADLGDIQRVTITPGMVLREFRALDWPKAPLSLEPGKGMTLVNMATNAFSENSGPLTQTVPMFGRSVEIEATPDTWTWHWGDGSVDSTTHPGQPRPTGGVSHAYVRAADRVNVRVDLTYVGRFRVEGGPWVAIGEPRTMRGDSQVLSVREAVTQLIR